MFFERLLKGYNEMKVSDGVFMVWTTLKLLGVYTLALGHTLACISCHGRMGSLLTALATVSRGFRFDVIWMSMVDFGLRLVFCVLESVCHALCMLSSTFVCLD